MLSVWYFTSASLTFVCLAFCCLTMTVLCCPSSGARLLGLVPWLFKSGANLSTTLAGQDAVAEFHAGFQAQELLKFKVSGAGKRDWLYISTDIVLCHGLTFRFAFFLLALTPGPCATERGQLHVPYAEQRWRRGSRPQLCHPHFLSG